MNVELPPAELPAGSEVRMCNALPKVRTGHSTPPPSVIVRIYPTVKTLGEFLTDIVTSAHDCGVEEAALSLTCATDTEEYRKLLSHTYAALSHVNRESAAVLTVLTSGDGSGRRGGATDGSGRRSQLEVDLYIHLFWFVFKHGVLRSDPKCRFQTPFKNDLILR